MVVGKGPQHPAGSWERSKEGGGRKGAAAVAAEGVVGQEESQEEQDGATAAASPAPAGPKIHSHASSVASSLYLSSLYFWVLGRGHADVEAGGLWRVGCGWVGG